MLKIYFGVKMKNLTPAELEKMLQKREKERRQAPLHKRLYFAWEHLYRCWQLREFYKRTWLFKALRYGVRMIIKLPYK